MIKEMEREGLKSYLSLVGNIPDLMAREVLLNITSGLGSIGRKAWVFRYSYCASKAALNMFSKMLSLELKEKGIVVIPMHPGHVQTDLGGYSAPLKPEQSIGGMIICLFVQKIVNINV